jgi:hypothetical protein
MLLRILIVVASLKFISRQGHAMVHNLVILVTCCLNLHGVMNLNDPYITKIVHACRVDMPKHTNRMSHQYDSHFEIIIIC